MNSFAVHIIEKTSINFNAKLELKTYFEMSPYAYQLIPEKEDALAFFRFDVKEA